MMQIYGEMTYIYMYITILDQNSENAPLNCGLYACKLANLSWQLVRYIL